MKGTKTQAVEGGAADAAEPAGPAAEGRRLDLLRQIALAGGGATPNADHAAEHGYAYMLPGDDVERDLSILARRGHLEQRFFERVSLCPKCDSHRLNVREICPGCRRPHLRAEGLLHHFRCGYTGIPAEFALAKDGAYICPKCNGGMHYIGTQYDRLGRAFLCKSCGVISENPPVEAVCFTCAERTPAENLVSAEIFSYALTSRGAAAIRSGSLADDDEDGAVAMPDAPAYNRIVTLEFLDHHLKCLQEFKSVFSLLVIECAPSALDQRGDDSLAQWLARLRAAMREVDLLGRLAEARFVAILPLTRRRAAEASCQRIRAALGPRSPFTLTVFEITEAPQLTRIVAGRNTLERSQ